MIHAIGNFGVLPFRELLNLAQRAEEKLLPTESEPLSKMPIRCKFQFWDACIRCLTLVVNVAAPVFLITLGSINAFSQDRIRYGDIVDIDVDGGFEFDWRGGIDPEGNLAGITPFGDLVPAVCRTETELSAAISERMRSVLRSPRVVVRIIDRSNRALAIVEGSVRNSTRFRISRDVRILELIVMSGGLTDDASGEIQLFRPSALNCEQTAPIGNGTQFTNIKIKDLIAGTPTANPLIRSGDIVNVRTADEIYVIGSVENPRPLSSRSQTTVSRAVSASGGATKRSSGKVIVYRRENGQTKLIECDLTAIAAGSAEDLPLKAFDIVDVRGKNEERRKFTPVLTGRGRTVSGQMPLKIVD